MSEDAVRIQRFVGSLIRRDRTLLLMRVVARAALLGLAVLAITVLAAVVGADRGAAALVVALIAGVGAWIAVFLPLFEGWRSSGDPLVQARRVEQLRPELRGRLITAVGTSAGASPSEPLRERVVGLAAAGVRDLTPEQVVDSRRSTIHAALAAVLWAVGVPALLLLPGGPRGLLEFWVARTGARAEVAGPVPGAPEDQAQVGDILLRYTYPDYTGLEPHEVPNSTGDVQAPPGTQVEVTVRTGHAVTAAGLVAYGDSLEAQVGGDNRTVSARFGVRTEAGEYQLVLYRESEPESSRAFTITPMADLPPEVVLEAQAAVIEVALDQPFPVTWNARDDYGIASVSLAVDGREVEPPLVQPDRRVAELRESDRLITPRDLGLSAGDQVRLSVVAWDNDTVSGSKRGESSEVDLIVLGARGLSVRAEMLREQLLSQMVPVLARFYTEDWPVGRRGGALATWGQVVAERYDPLMEAVDEIWSGTSSNSLDRAVAERVVSAGRDLVRYTQTSFSPGSTERQAWISSHSRTGAGSAVHCSRCANMRRTRAAR